ncbi:hypothetical protein H6G81_27435 [Scytonema hofmannii FACHB-248]|uniref:Uncharacterized protein n=1 Tax=Scytonema hofmannii FACHB-248 TaxID=1842502 RepID=A0ABR8GYP9_9CYAN|nr:MULTISPECIES: hypothetical protein [Nostocales]MBD2608146.1 hypothetical protein [Scytonema hofmannii FACHB-248]
MDLESQIRVESSQALSIVRAYLSLQEIVGDLYAEADNAAAARKLSKK